MKLRSIIAIAFLAIALISIDMNRRAAFTTHAYVLRESIEPIQDSVVAAAPDVALVREIDLTQLKSLLERGSAGKSRPLLVNFWATWCDPCREEFPDLVKINSDYKKRGLEFITISLDDPEEVKGSVPAFLRDMRADMPTYLLNTPDADPAIKSVDATWKGELPATFLYDSQGKIAFRHTGRIKPAELRAAIDKLLK